MVRMVTQGVIEAVDGTLTKIDAQSICVHGDSPGAVAIAQRLRTLLEQSGLAIRAFTAAR
jgi:UPF0271 protein